MKAIISVKSRSRNVESMDISRVIIIFIKLIYLFFALGTQFPRAEKLSKAN